MSGLLEQHRLQQIRLLAETAARRGEPAPAKPTAAAVAKPAAVAKQSRRVAVAPAPTPAAVDRPGTELQAIYAALSVAKKSNCGCTAKQQEMDRIGSAGCRARLAEIIQWQRDGMHEYTLTERARAAWHMLTSGLAREIGIVNWADPFPALVELAISRAEASLEAETERQAAARRPLVVNPTAELCIVTGYTPHDRGWAELGGLTSTANRAYCERHGYGFRLHTADFETHIDAAWSKVKFLRQALALHAAVLWVDADAVITAPGPLDFLDDIREDMAVSTDPIGINTGVWYIRRSSVTNKILSQIWDLRREPFPLWEQDALTKLFFAGKTHGQLKVLPPRSLNSSPPVLSRAAEYVWQPGDAACHAYGRCPDKPTSLKSIIERAKAPTTRVNPNVSRPLPESGLLSPQHQRIIAIEVTNACPNTCSNCTRLCPHQTKPFFMERKTFSAAVESLNGYRGLVSIMGGEPTIHPDFPWLAQHAHEVLQGGIDSDHGRQPIADLAEYREALLTSMHSPLGLFSALGTGYRKHFELIQRIFRSQWINSHEAGGLHQALLLSRKDLAIPDDVWRAKRNRCWIQRLWSSCVTDQGCYFCEVAGAIDRLLFGGRRAWPIEPGWWKRTPDQFGEQLDLCEYCAAPLAGPRRPDTEGRQDCSRTTAELLKAVSSPAANAGKLVIHGPECLGPDYSLRIDNYLETDHGDAPRVTVRQDALRPREVVGIVVCVDFAPILQQVIGHNIHQVDRLVVVTTHDDLETQRVATANGAQVVLSDRCWDHHASFNKGAMLNDALAAAKPRDWVLFHDADILLPPTLKQWTSSHILNPGCLYWTSRYTATDAAQTSAIRADWRSIAGATFRHDHIDRQPWGYFQLWNPRAACLAGLSPLVSEDFPTAGAVDWHFRLRWPVDRQIRIDDDSRTLSVAHVHHGEFCAAWHGRGGEGRWRLAAQTGLDGRLWYLHGTPLTYPCHVRRLRIDTAESTDVHLVDERRMQEWVEHGILFDVYVI